MQQSETMPDLVLPDRFLCLKCGRAWAKAHPDFTTDDLVFAAVLYASETYIMGTEKHKRAIEYFITGARLARANFTKAEKGKDDA